SAAPRRRRTATRTATTPAFRPLPIGSASARSTSRSALTPTTSSAGLSPGTQERRPIRAALLCVRTPDARFANYGDHIYLCDHAEHGRPVMVGVKYYHEAGCWQTLERRNWCGPTQDNGCKGIHLRV